MKIDAIGKNSIEGMEKVEVISYKNELQGHLESCEQNFKDLIEDRRNQITIVKTLRIAMKDLDSMDGGRRKLLNDFHGYRKAAEASKNKRDEVNKLIPPPSDILEKWISKSYTSLTTIDNDLTVVPSLNQEKRLFKQFFELQVCISKKKESEDAHKEYVSNIKQLKDISKKLDMHQEEKEKNMAEMTDGMELEGSTVSRKQIRKISKNITGIDKKLDLLKIERNDIRAEINKIKIILKDQFSKVRKINIEEVHEKIEDGGTLDTSEFAILLNKGNLSNLDVKKKDKGQKIKNKNSNKKKKRKLGAVQRKSRRGSAAALRENE